METLRQLAATTLTPDDNIDYGGAMRQFVQQSSGFILTFAFAVIIIFLALSALFNSFRDPLIILVSVPMSIAGAMIFIYLGFGGLTLNIYTEVGLVTLMGLVSKHGILMVEVANEARLAGRAKREAIEYAASIRLRPILMTTAAMVLGVVPLILPVVRVLRRGSTWAWSSPAACRSARCSRSSWCRRCIWSSRATNRRWWIRRRLKLRLEAVALKRKSPSLKKLRA